MKEATIIGAGISGLTLGCYLQLNGFRTNIFEAHSRSGGLCTSWKRNGYTFDGSIHSTISPKGNRKLNKWFAELIDPTLLKYHYYDELSRVDFEDREPFHFYTDPSGLSDELMRIAPEDSGFIRSMIAGIRTFSKHDMQPSKPIELWKPWDYYARQFITLPYLAKLARWSKSIEDSLSKCRSGLLKQVLHQDFFTRYPFYFMLISIGEMDRRNVGYPIGGSLSIADMIEKKYLHLGGRIHFDARVKKILVNKNRAEGIVLENGNIEARSDFVVSAADGFSTIFELLEGNYVDKSISSRYNGHAKWPSAILVSLGVSRTFPGEPDLIELRLKKPLVIDERSKADSLPVTIYKFDPTLAPKGKTCLRVILHTDNFSYWQKLRVNHESTYKAEKERIAEQVIETLEKRIGGIKRSLETIDVATPATLFRYTSNWNGSIQGWQWLPGLIPEHMKSFLPKLQRFWMTGQWTMPGGGISGAFISARDLARVICRRNGIRFTGV